MTARSILTIHFPPPSATFANIWLAGRRMLQARATRRLLAEMDGWMLSDIGISRGEARTEAARPLWDLSASRR